MVTGAFEGPSLYAGLRRTNHAAIRTSASASVAKMTASIDWKSHYYRGHGRGKDRGNVGIKHAEVVTAGLTQDARGWLRLAS